MEKGEEPMKFFSRVDTIVGTLSSLGVQKSVGDVNRKLVRVLTNDYEMEQRTLLYRDDVSLEEIESIVRQRHLRLPVTKVRNVGQARCWPRWPRRWAWRWSRKQPQQW